MSQQVIDMTPQDFQDFIDSVRIELGQELAKKISYDAPIGAKAVLSRGIRSQDNKNDTTVLGPKYAVYVEYGTGPRDTLPPDKPIREWVRAVKGLEGKELDTFVWFLRKKIARDGTESNPFIRNILRADLPRIALRIMQNKLKTFKQQSKENKKAVDAVAQTVL